MPAFSQELYLKKTLLHWCFPEYLANFLRTPFWLIIQYTFVIDYYTAWKVSLLGVFLVLIFQYSDWIRRGTDNLSVYSPNAGKYVPEKLRIWALFTQCYFWSSNNPSVQYQQYIYFKPYTRISPYLVGLILGYIISNKISINGIHRKVRDF